jgi:hypothetical protein
MLTTQEFIDLVKKMRASQKDYFKSRNYGDLARSKYLEKQVDDEIKVFARERLL